MKKESNVTLIYLGGYGEIEKFRYVFFAIVYTLFMLIICFNFTIVSLIVKHKNLHQPMYIFIVALLVNSVLFSIVIYPKLLIDFLSEKQTILYPACIFQGVTYYSVAYSEFLILSAMAYDRYVSICKPLQYQTIMKKSRICVFLVLAWFVPVCKVAGVFALNLDLKLCSFTLNGVFCNNALFKLFCTSTKALSIYGVILLINLGLLPVLFILFTYGRILMITYHSCREVRMKAVRTCLPHLIVLFNFSCFFTFDVTVVRLKSDLPKTTSLLINLQVVLYHPLINPLIYGLKMKEIHQHLRRLFY